MRAEEIHAAFHDAGVYTDTERATLYLSLESDQEPNLLNLDYPADTDPNPEEIAGRMREAIPGLTIERPPFVSEWSRPAEVEGKSAALIEFRLPDDE